MVTNSYVVGSNFLWLTKRQTNKSRHLSNVLLLDVTSVSSFILGLQSQRSRVVKQKRGIRWDTVGPSLSLWLKTYHETHNVSPKYRSRRGWRRREWSPPNGDSSQTPRYLAPRRPRLSTLKRPTNTSVLSERLSEPSYPAGLVGLLRPTSHVAARGTVALSRPYTSGTACSCVVFGHGVTGPVTKSRSLRSRGTCSNRYRPLSNLTGSTPPHTSHDDRSHLLASGPYNDL